MPDNPDRRPYYERRRTGPSSEQQAMTEPAKDVLAGVHAVLEAIKAGRQIEKILIDKELPSNERLQELYELARRTKLPVQKVPVQALNARAQRHQGVVAYVAPFEYIRLSEALRRVIEQGVEPFILVLDSVTDVRNAGALARTAECAGVQILVVPMLGTAPLSQEAFKSSAGALEHIYVCREANLDKTVAFLKDNGINVCAVTEKANKDIFYADLKGPIALILGSEETGINPEVLKAADQQFKLPMQGQIESLNVSAAGAVALFEVVRQRISQ